MVLFGLIINNCFSKTLKIDSSTVDSIPALVDTIVTDSASSNSLPASQNGPEMKVEYSAKDSIELDNSQQILHLYGEANVLYGDMSMEADKITIYLATNEVHAFGKKDSLGILVEKVRFQDGEEFFLAPEMKYNFKTKKGKIYQIYTQEGDLHLHAGQAKKMPDDNIYVKKGKITTCDHEDPHFYFSASKLKVIPGKVMVAGPTHLVVRDFHTPIWVPFGIFPNNSEKQSGIIIPSQGADASGNAGITDFGYHWAVNDYLHLEFLSSFYFGGSYQLAATAQYLKKYKYSGSFGLRHNNTITGIKGLSNHAVKKDYNLTWNHKQDSKAHPKSNLNVGINAKTGTYNQTQLLNQSNINTFVEGSNSSQLNWNWREKWGGLNVSSRFDQNFATKSLTLKLPSIAMNMTNQKIYKNFQVSGNVQLENSITAIDSVFAEQWSELMRNGLRATTVFDVGSSYSIPLPILKYFKFSMPRLTVNGYANTKYINKEIVSDTLQESVIKNIKGSYDFNFSNFGVTTKIYGIYKMRPGAYINAFRHTITPAATMSYSPDFFIDAQDIHRTYTDPTTGEEVEYSIYENRNYSMHTPNATESWRLNYSLRNNLQAKVRDRKDSSETYKKINLISGLDLSGSYNFLAEEFKWSDVRIGLNTNPGFLKNFNVNATISPYAMDSLGTKINTLLWDSVKQVGRLTNFDIGTRIALKRRFFIKNDKKAKENPFDWSLDLNYTFRYSKPGIADATTSNVVGLTGSVTLTKNWSFSYAAPVRVKERDLDPQTTNINITRTIHCWEILVMWRPLAPNNTAQYSITIRPKSSLLADLKYDKKIGRDGLF